MVKLIVFPLFFYRKCVFYSILKLINYNRLRVISINSFHRNPFSTVECVMNCLSQLCRKKWLLKNIDDPIF